MIRHIALFDIDNTMYDGFSYFALLDQQAAEGLIKKSVVDDALASMRKYKTGEQDYEATIVELLDIYAAGLAGVPYAAAHESAKQFYTASTKFFSYAKPTIQELWGAYDVAIVTGEPQFVAEVVSSLFGIPLHYSSEYEVKDERLTGNVTRYLASRHEKHDAIKHLMKGHGANKSFAFGDSEGDIEMLRAVEYPICLNPTPGLRAIAEKEGWHMPELDEVPALIARLRAK